MIYGYYGYRPTLCILMEKDFEKRPIQKIIREHAKIMDVECYDILQDASIIEQFIESRDMNLRFLFVDVFEIKQQFQPEIVETLLHGMGWARNMRIFVTVKTISVFGPRIRYSKMKYIVSLDDDGKVYFYDPDKPDEILTDLYLLSEMVIRKKFLGKADT